jgi:hypothetical protein
MKTKQLHFPIFYKGCVFTMICLLSISSIAAPPDFDFRNPTLISGTNLQLNARYRFANVKTGVDAVVTIMAFSGGVTLNQMDGPTGYVEAFQPVIFAPANSNGYVEFRIQFVTSGTLAGLSMPNISSTSLDIDGTLSGTGNLFEYDMVALNAATSVYNFDMGTTELSMSSSGGWVTGRNVTGNNYNGVDTSAKNVMFTVTNYNASSIRVRVGTDNRSTAGTARNKSIYFANFTYSSGLLSKNPLTYFNGTYTKSKVLLEWQLEKSAETAKILVERSSTGDDYLSIQQYNVSETSNKTNFQFPDYRVFYDKVYYRLKVIHIDGSVHYSKVITIHPPANAAFAVHVYGEGFAGRPSVIVNSPHPTPASLTIVDMAGNVKFRTNMNLLEGKNNLRLENTGLLKHGYHVVILQVGSRLYTNKFLATAL